MPLWLTSGVVICPVEIDWRMEKIMPKTNRKPLPVVKAEPPARKARKSGTHTSVTPKSAGLVATTAATVSDQRRYDALCAYREKCVAQMVYHRERMHKGCNRPQCNHHAAFGQWSDRIDHTDWLIRVGEQTGRWGVDVAVSA